MRIALIRQKYTPFGGAERYMARLVEGLAKEGHEVHILAAQWDSGGEAAVTLHRVPVVRKPGWLKALTFSLGCKKIITRERFDVVFSLERTLSQDVYRAGDGCHRQWLRQKQLGRGLLSRLVTYLNPIQLAYLHLERGLFTDPRLKAIIANSRAGKAEIVRLYGVDPEKIHVVYNGIDAASFPLEQREEYREGLAREYGLAGELRILYVGSGFARKGVPALVEAAALLQIPFTLFVVGKGRAGALQRRVKRLAPSGRVVFTGPVRDVERFYLGCDLFVFPTLYDPFSNATLEAMACGLPVITSRFNGVAELIEEGKSGFVLADPLDAGEIARCITELGEENLRREMGRGARLAVQELTMVRNSRESLAVLEKVMQGAPAGLPKDSL
jgi:UDP-glucose:(heptosyl)LPS alpha-1,3-glucosyltransferase